MANAWITHVKEFAQRNGLTYGCALSTPECKAEYQQNKKPKQPDYTTQMNRIGALVRSKNKEAAIKGFNDLLPKVKALSGEAKDRQMMLLSSLRKAIGKLQAVSAPKKEVKWDVPVKKMGLVTIAPEVQFQKLEENLPSIEPVKKKISIKPRKKEAAKKAPAPKKAPKKAAAPKASNILPVEAIVSEWDTPQIPIVLAQSEHRNILYKIETLADKGSYVVPADLFSLHKKLLGELYKKYSIKQIDDVMVEIIEHIGGKPVAGEYTRYEKSMPSVRQKKKLHAEISKFK